MATVVRLQQFSNVYLSRVLKRCMISQRTTQFVRSFRVSATKYGTTILKMPSLSPTMYEGTIVKWLKQEGEPVSAGDIICEIQTDKAVVGFEMEEDGILAKILMPDDSKEVKIGTVIGLMVEEDDDWQNVAIPAEAMTKPPTESQPEAAVPSATAVSMATDSQSYGPAVRSILDMYQIKPGDVPATGPHYRLLKGDLLQYIKARGLKPAPQTAEAPPAFTTPAAPTPVQKPAPAPSTQLSKPATLPADGSPFTDIDLSNIRSIIARRLTESKMSTPHSYYTIDNNMGPVLSLRKELLADGVKVSVNDFIIKAVAVALQRVPEVNAVWTEQGGKVVSNIDVSIAVATDTGLITPIVKDAIGLGVEEISKTVKELAGRAREGKLMPNEFQGGTFTISNLGMFGVSEFTAVINPPQACILAVGSSRAELGLDGKPQTMMKVTVSADGRVVNEFLASQFLETFKEIMENPMLMLSQGPKIDVQKLFVK